jgi:bacillithiol synthase
MDIPFHRIPHQSTLFLKYLECSPDAVHFLHHTPTMKSLQETALEIRNLKFPRSEIVSILRNQNESYGAGKATMSRITELESPDCMAILTGQQIGLFTGPLYTIYKAISAIRIAEELTRRGINAVPIFWMDTEDHDLAEVTHRTVPVPDSSLKTIDYSGILFNESERSARSVGSIIFPENIQRVIDDYLSFLPDTDQKTAIRIQLEATYSAGSTFTQSFARLITEILSGFGLILFDPHDRRVKKLTSAVFRKALAEENTIRTALMKRSQELVSAGFHAQVNVLENSTVLFFYEGGERRALERNDSGYGLKNNGRTFSTEELMKEVEQNPEKFSPNVLLRPLVQDHLFPTLAYVGGSSELAYFAQIETLYTLYHRPMPVIWPRNSFTLLPSESSAEMNRLGIDFEDFFQGKQCVTEKAMRNSGFLKAAAGLDELQDHINQIMAEIKPDLEAFDPTLAQAMETSQRKILHNIQRLKARAIHFEGTQNASFPTTIDRLLNSCYPNSTLQEREFGIQDFFVRYGASLIDTIFSSTDIGCFAHRVIEL